MSLSALFGRASARIRGQKWGTRIADKNGDMRDTGVNTAMDMLYAVLNSQEPIILDTPIQLVNNTGQAPFQIVQNGGSNDIMNVTNEDGDIFNLTQTTVEHTVNNNTYITNFLPPGVPDPTDPFPPGFPNPTDPDYPGDNPNVPQPPNTPGGGPSPEDIIALIIKTWNEVLHVRGFLTSAITAPSNPSSPTTATMSIYRFDSQQGWYNTGDTATLTIRDTSLEAESGLYVHAVWSDGQYEPIWVECEE